MSKHSGLALMVSLRVLTELHSIDGDLGGATIEDDEGVNDDEAFPLRVLDDANDDGLAAAAEKEEDEDAVTGVSPALIGNPLALNWI